MASNDGKWLEHKVQADLIKHKANHKSFFYRFYDTTSARGSFLPPSPGDFLWNYKSVSTLIECKSTATGKDLWQLINSSKTSKLQIPRHRMWHLSGCPSIYVWGNVETGEIKVYCGESVVEAFMSKDKTKMKGIRNELIKI
jgi:hypothetical protein